MTGRPPLSLSWQWRWRAGRWRSWGWPRRAPRGTPGSWTSWWRRGVAPPPRPGACAWRALPRGPLDADLRDAPDLFPVLAVALARLGGRLAGLSGLVHKESDRLAEMARLLGELGASLQREGDEVRAVGGARLVAPSHDLDPAGDHRVAMALAVAGLVAPGLRLADPGCVGKSWPRFWEAWEGLVGNGMTQASWLAREHLSAAGVGDLVPARPRGRRDHRRPDPGRPGGAPLAAQPAVGRRGAGPGRRQLPAGARLLSRAAGAAWRQAPEAGPHRDPAPDLSPAVAAGWPAPRATAPATPGLGRGPAGAGTPAAACAAASRSGDQPWKRWSGVDRPGRWPEGGSGCCWPDSGTRRSPTPMVRAGRSGRVVWRRWLPESGGPRRKPRRAGWRRRWRQATRPWKRWSASWTRRTWCGTRPGPPPPEGTP